MTFIILPQAKSDTRKAVDYYKKISPQLAKRFIQHLRSAKTFIKENPLAVAIEYKNVRTHSLQSFPYQIHYIIDQNKIIVLAIAFAKMENLDFSHRT